MCPNPNVVNVADYGEVLDVATLGKLSVDRGTD
jgi:hypothetical protein